MRTVTVTVPVWCGSTYYGPADLQTMEPKKLVDTVSFFSFTPSSSYVRVGDADVTIRLFANEQMTANAVEMLRQQKDKVRAEAEAAITRIDTQINNLLAITYEPEAA
jgi:hypothetical protein